MEDVLALPDQLYEYVPDPDVNTAALPDDAVEQMTFEVTELLITLFTVGKTVEAIHPFDAS